MPDNESYFTDAHFVDELIHLLVNDRKVLKDTSHLLNQDDFKQLENEEGRERRLVAHLALKYYREHKEPIGRMLRSYLLDFCRSKRLEGATRERLFEYGAHFTNGHKRVAPDAMVERVLRYKTEHQIALAMEQMQGLIERGELTRDSFIEIARSAVVGTGVDVAQAVDIFEDAELEKRITRRAHEQQRIRFPVLLIDPIDRLVRAISREHLGLVMAPYGRGKSMFFIWIALAYVLQGYNVMLFTLEDPLRDVEDRLDAAISELPMSRLGEMTDDLRARFQRYKRVLKTRLKVIDGTDGLTTIPAIEAIFEQERNNGFFADAIIVDYDDEIRPVQKRAERRFEFADIYRDFRALLARHQLIGWTASQTGRQTEDMRIIGGKHIAEDISKMRKCTFAVSLGQGDWGDDSIFLWVAKNRNDKQHVGANILTSKESALFFDRDATLKREAIERSQAVDGVVQ